MRDIVTIGANLESALLSVNILDCVLMAPDYILIWSYSNTGHYSQKIFKIDTP